MMEGFQLNFVIFAAADVYSRNDFPPGFVFGASTSAFQHEGVAYEDGRTPRNGGHELSSFSWVICASTIRKMYNSWHIQAWKPTDFPLHGQESRLIPNGRGLVNLKGLQYYNNLSIELIINAGIQPHVTLNHADLPQALEVEYGGWINRKIVRDFVAYASESLVIGFYIRLLSGKVIQEKHQETQHGFIELNLCTYWFVPLTNTIEDIITTQRANDFFYGWYMHPWYIETILAR
ncbi:hypothetical protein PTKIN_Ptkin11bG0080700 [Pterospermum kingtungense]